MTEPTIRKLGKYEIRAELGRGNFAVVYRARDPGLDREVALKVLDPVLTRDETFVKQFYREARTAARLSHRHIVTIYEMGEAEELLFLAMELINGPNLRELVQAEGPLPFERAVTLLEQVASALDYAHGQGLVHRDVKGANVLIGDDGTASGRAVLSDFGLVKALSGSVYATNPSLTGGRFVGTPQYMSPEQCEGEPGDARSDVYALGVVAYEALTGQVPFNAPTPLPVMLAHTQKPPPPLRELRPELPEPLAEAVLWALEKDPDARPQSAGAFAAALREALATSERVSTRPAKLATGEERLQAHDWAGALAVAAELLAMDAADAEAADLRDRAQAGLRAAAEVEEQTRKAREQAEREKRRQEQLAEGARKLEEGDWAGALAVAAELLVADPGDVEAIRLKQQTEATREGMEESDQKETRLPKGAGDTEGQGVAVPKWLLGIVVLITMIGVAVIARSKLQPVQMNVEEEVTATTATARATSTTAEVVAKEASSSIATAAPTETSRPPTTAQGASASTTTSADAIVNAEQLNMRSGPGTEYTKVASYVQGTTLSVLGKNAAGDWLYVRAPDGKKGWMAKTYLLVRVDTPG